MGLTRTATYSREMTIPGHRMDRERAPASAARREAERDPDVAPHHAAVLALQRQAGNRAVGTVLAREPAGTVDFKSRVTQPPKGAFAGRKLGSWGKYITSDLVATERIERNCATVEEATALARSLARPAAVVREKVYAPGDNADGTDAYLIYAITVDSLLAFDRDNTQWTASSLTTVRQDPAVPLEGFVTVDGTVIKPPAGKDGPARGGLLEQQTGSGAVDPFSGHREAFGEGLDKIKTGDPARDKEIFLRQFGLALEDTVFAVLAASETQAKAKQDTLTAGVPAEDVPVIEAELPKLIKVDADLRTARQKLQAFQEAARTHSDEFGVEDRPADPVAAQADVATAQQQVDDLSVQRNEIFARYPLLSQVDPVAFQAMPADQRATALRSASGQVLRDIETTRGNVLGKGVDVWELGPVVQATLVGLGIKDASFRTWALEKAKWERTKAIAFDIALGVLQVGLGIAASVFTAGLAGVALAAGALTVGVVGAATQTANYFKDKAAANTNLDKTQSLDPKDLDGQWAWIALAWIGVGLDAGTVVSALRTAAKEGWTVKAAAEYLTARVKNVPVDLFELAQRTLKPLTSESAHALLMQSVNPALRPRLGAVTVRVLEDKAFVQTYSSLAGEAVTIVSKDAKGATSIEVVVKETATPRAIADEATHLEQTLDPAKAERMAGLSEATKNWDKLTVPKQLQAYADKLELEADAMRTTLKTLSDEDEIADFNETLSALEERLGQVRKGLAETDPEKMLAHIPGFDPKQPPLLFAKARLPRTDGTWAGSPGNGLWYSNKPEVIAITGGEGVQFRNNYPVFKKWSKATVEIDFKQGDHFAQADAAFAKQLERRGLRDEYPEFFKSQGKALPRGECNVSAIKEWRIRKGLTWHHHQGVGEQMLMLPRDLHANIPHTGGHAVSKGTHSL